MIILKGWNVAVLRNIKKIEIKNFKDIVSKKMDDSFENDDDSGLITKKFWSYVKANANNTRIPELLCLGDVCKTKLWLFNSFFYNQFSGASVYDIEVDNTQSPNFVIDFNHSRVLEILRNLNSSKVQLWVQTK